jgi:hypothetical protein
MDDMPEDDMQDLRTAIVGKTVNDNRVGIWDKDQRHPPSTEFPNGGEIFISDFGPHTVLLTPGVAAKIASGDLRELSPREVQRRQGLMQARQVAQRQNRDVAMAARAAENPPEAEVAQMRVSPVRQADPSQTPAPTPVAPVGPQAATQTSSPQSPRAEMTTQTPPAPPREADREANTDEPVGETSRTLSEEEDGEAGADHEQTGGRRRRQQHPDR